MKRAFDLVVVGMVKPVPWKRLICATGIFIFLFSSGSVAYANAPAPPTELWFVFEYEVASHSQLDGVQLLECDTETCGTPVLLQQYGVCSATDCLPPPPRLSTNWGDAAECVGNRCRFASAVYGCAYFKLIVQVSDQAYISDVASGLPSYYGERPAWRVSVRDTGLSVTQDNDFRRPGTRNASFLMWFGVTLVLELAVARLCLWMWKVGEGVIGKLFVVLLVNLATFPVVWWFFPSLGQLQPDAARKVGIFVLILALFYAAGLVRIYTTQGKKRLWTIVLYVLIFFMVGIVLLALAYFGFWYGNYTVHAAGLSPGVVLLLSEVFAVLAEAGLIAVMTRKTFSLWQVGLTSLLMNAASCGIGLLAIGLWWVY